MLSIPRTWQYVSTPESHSSVPPLSVIICVNLRVYTAAKAQRHPSDVTIWFETP